MFALLLSFAMLASSVGLFFGYVEGAYARWQAKEAKYQQVAKTNQNYLAYQQTLDGLIAQRNALQEETARLRKLLPDHVDMVRLILDIESIASQHKAVKVGSFTFSNSAQSSSNTQSAGSLPSSDFGGDFTAQQQPAAQSRYGEARISFTATAPYKEGIVFIRDLERSLRLLDVRTLSVKPGTSPDGSYLFTIDAATYWLP
ncbi:hypothetical protein D6792_00560 [Candidatus Parcubacteria bacterium]|jgi:Tfp pilus assembly protein PilO|nr:MAG: hypothetical protein D6792_00560 [Candidatus Parcubacteria bacterium]